MEVTDVKTKKKHFVTAKVWQPWQITDSKNVNMKNKKEENKL